MTSQPRSLPEISCLRFLGLDPGYETELNFKAKGLMTSQLRTFRARSILSAFVVPNFIL